MINLPLLYRQEGISQPLCAIISVIQGEPDLEMKEKVRLLLETCPSFEMAVLMNGLRSYNSSKSRLNKRSNSERQQRKNARELLKWNSVRTC